MQISAGVKIAFDMVCSTCIPTPHLCAATCLFYPCTKSVGAQKTTHAYYYNFANMTYWLDCCPPLVYPEVHLL